MMVSGTTMVSNVTTRPDATSVAAAEKRWQAYKDRPAFVKFLAKNNTAAFFLTKFLDIQSVACFRSACVIFSALTPHKYLSGQIFNNVQRIVLTGDTRIHPIWVEALKCAEMRAVEFVLRDADAQHMKWINMMLKGVERVALIFEQESDKQRDIPGIQLEMFMRVRLKVTKLVLNDVKPNEVALIAKLLPKIEKLSVSGKLDGAAKLKALSRLTDLEWDNNSKELWGDDDEIFSIPGLRRLKIGGFLGSPQFERLASAKSLVDLDISKTRRWGTGVLTFRIPATVRKLAADWLNGVTFEANAQLEELDTFQLREERWQCPPERYYLEKASSLKKLSGLLYQRLDFLERYPSLSDITFRFLNCNGPSNREFDLFARDPRVKVHTFSVHYFEEGRIDRWSKLMPKVQTLDCSLGPDLDKDCALLQKMLTKEADLKKREERFFKCTEIVVRSWLDNEIIDLKGRLIPILALLPRLTSVTLPFIKFTALPVLEELRELRLEHSEPSEAFFESLSETAPGLKRLHLIRCKGIDDKCVAVIKKRHPTIAINFESC